MKRKWMALLLALALIVSLASVSALAAVENGAAGDDTGEAAAAEETETQEAALDSGAESTESADGGDETPEDGTTPGEAEPAPVSPAGPDAAPEKDPDTGELISQVTIEPDAVGTVSFANVERRMRENNLTILGVEEYIKILDELDYEELEDDARQGLNQIANLQWNVTMMAGGINSLFNTLAGLGSSVPGSSGEGSGLGQVGELMFAPTIQALAQQYTAAREAFDDIRDGTMKADNDAQARQLKNSQDQLILGGEAMYIALRTMELQETQLERQLAAMDRSVAEMELRYARGQISALQLAQVKGGRTSLVSGLTTLQMNIGTMKYQLEQFIGAEQTGTIALGDVPEVTAEQLGAMDLETDLAAAKAASYELFNAARTLADAKEEYNDAGSSDSAAKHTWNAAQYTYNNTVQDYERRFRTLYAQVGDYKQILDAAKVSLETEKSSYAAQALRYEQGNISHNALLDAEDSLRTAQETVTSAANDLFSAYNNYCWAVKNGVLN